MDLIEDLKLQALRGIFEDLKLQALRGINLLILFIPAYIQIRIIFTSPQWTQPFSNPSQPNLIDEIDGIIFSEPLQTNTTNIEDLVTIFDAPNERVHLEKKRESCCDKLSALT